MPQLDWIIMPIDELVERARTMMDEDAHKQFVTLLGISEYFGTLDKFREDLQRAADRGYQQGLQRGAREVAIRNVLRVLKIRFGDEAESQRTRLEQVEDLELLSHFMDRAVQVQSLAVFCAELGPASGEVSDVDSLAGCAGSN